jgi:cell division protein FtsZ
VPITEVDDKGIVRYSLEEYMEIENSLTESKPVSKVAEPENEALQLTVKTVAVPETQNNTGEDVPLTERTIEESTRLTADERRRKLKEFNYKFHNNPSRVEEFEKEPAYKRQGIDLSNQASSSNASRTSLGTDSNNDIQLRSNNSFLHDNVD